MRALFFLLFIVPVFLSCKTKINSTKVDSELAKSNAAAESVNLMQVDKAFSEMSKEQGMKNAFMEYLDSNGVLLRPGQMPLEGGDAVDWLIQQTDNEYTLTWTPRHAEVSSVGDLGVTYGIYNFKLKDSDSSHLGTYLRIWKKQQDGKWKLLQDTNNEGISN